MTNWILLFWLIFLFFVFYLSYNRRIGPSNIFLLSFMVSLIVVLINDSVFMYEIGWSTVIILSLVLIVFHSFTLVPLFFRKKGYSTNLLYKVVIPKKWLLLAYTIVFTNLILKYRYIMATGAEFGASNLISSYAATRLMLIDYANTGVAEVRMPYYAILVALMAGCTEILCMHMALYEKVILKKWDKKLWGVIAIYVVSLFLETGRAALFPVVIHVVYLGILFGDISKSIGSFIKIHFFKISSLIFIGILVFLVMGSLRQDKEGTGDIELSASKTLASYVGAPIIGLDIYINRGIKQNYYYGEHTFRDYYDWARFLGIPYKRAQFHKDDFYVGKGGSNVYTGLYYWLSDFNVLGALVYAMLLGFIFGKFFSRKEKYGNICGCYLCSFFYFCLIMMFFDDQFNSIWGINMILKLSIIYYFQKRFFIVVNNEKS